MIGAVSYSAEKKKPDNRIQPESEPDAQTADLVPLAAKSAESDA